MPRKKPNSKKASTAKRSGPSRAAKVDRWDADYLTTNPKSALVESDLIGLLATPDVWAQMTKEELEHINTLFPDHVPRNENGSISLDWLRYDNDWRHGIRQWQADLEAGHLDPKWQREAALAMEERAAGNFDKFKEEEFEEFWGQKQKMHSRMLAGQSSVLKLPNLIAGSLFKEGDFWVYSRTFVRGNDKTEIVKDCKIIEIGDNFLTFEIPPGKLRYARQINLGMSAEQGGSPEDETKIDLSARSDISNGTPVGESAIDEKNMDGEGMMEDVEGVENGVKETLPSAQKEGDGEDSAMDEALEEIKGTISPEAAEDVVQCKILNIQMLETKILELDGRMKNLWPHNAWKCFRCQRNNQDMGSLFEIREQYYVWKYAP